MFSSAYAATLPLQGTVAAGHWDQLYWFLVILSAFFFVAIIGAMIYFAIAYRSGNVKKTKYVTGSHTLEAIFVGFPLVLLLVIFGWGYVVYHEMTAAPTDAYEIRVIGRQWMWNFQYDHGKLTTNELYVPAGRPVKLIMTSEDVIHSFYVPNFRIKQDVVPGMYTSIWFETSVVGKHQIFCAEYCGTSHSGMLGKVIALNEKDWADWVKGKKIPPQPPAGTEYTPEELAKMSAEADTQIVSASLPEQGAKLAESKGCVACHTADGSAKVGPTWKGVFGKQEELADGSKVTVDENYLRESIENPTAKVVKGFAPSMPPYKGLVNETEINALIAYIKSLK